MSKERQGTKQQTIGYIVVILDRATQSVMELRRDLGDARGQLYLSEIATLFPTRDRAHRAIQRTIRAYNSHATPDGESWDFVKSIGRMQVRRVVQ